MMSITSYQYQIRLTQLKDDATSIISASIYLNVFDTIDLDSKLRNKIYDLQTKLSAIYDEYKEVSTELLKFSKNSIDNNAPRDIVLPGPACGYDYSPSSDEISSLCNSSSDIILPDPSYI